VTVVLNEKLPLCITEMHMREWRYYSFILNLRTGQRLVISSTAYCTPVKQLQLVWLQSQYGCFGGKKIIFYILGSEPQIIQPRAVTVLCCASSLICSRGVLNSDTQDTFDSAS